MKKLLTKYGHLLATFALAISVYSADWCLYIFHQPKVPESVMKLRKNLRT